MYENKGNPLNLTVLRQSEKIKISITPVLDPSEQRYMIGIEPTFAKATISEGFKYGFLNSWSFIKQIAGFFKSLITGNASTEDVSGPVGIIKFTGEAAKQGFSSLLVFTAFLSINLAILNLVPFPALDGGWLLILFIEGIRRKKLDANKIGILNFVGFAFLMLLTVIVTFRDFIRLNIF
jgi:regulator of sigma E protease